MVICKGSTEDTKEFIQKIYGIHIATGTISHIIKEASEKAMAFNQSIPLNTIEVGANDEIFQAGEPVLVGVDVYSTFIYLMGCRQHCRFILTINNIITINKEFHRCLYINNGVLIT